MLSVARERTNDFERCCAIATVPKDSSGHLLMEVTTRTSGVRHGFAILSSVNHSPILLGTSSFTTTGWQGSFYPKGLRPADYLSSRFGAWKHRGWFILRNEPDNLCFLISVQGGWGRA